MTLLTKYQGPLIPICLTICVFGEEPSVTCPKKLSILVEEVIAVISIYKH